MFQTQYRPIAVDLFAGVGGMSLGFEQAGFDVVAAIEIDPVHCAAHKFNFPNTHVIARTVNGLKASDIRVASGIGSRPIDCVFGGPPCQGFSLIGQRILDDPRNSLVLEFVRLVADLNAKTFVFENVKGLTVGKHKNFLNELIAAFDKAGYEVRLPWRVFDAAQFGVPQHRHRLILMGAKKGCALPIYPEPGFIPADTKIIDSANPIGPTCKDALGDLPNSDRFEVLIVNDSHWTSTSSKCSGYAAELRCLTESAWHFGYKRKWNNAILTSSARTTHSEISRKRFAETKTGDVEPISRFFKLPPDGLSNTLRAGTDSARGAFTSPRPIHYKYPRCITVREMARLHGFPDWFRFNATKWHGARQVGNAVPPALARAIASKIMTGIGVTPIRPSELVELGDSQLLYMGAGIAAEFFGVEPPNGRRDRKSGAKKRKQIDIEESRLQLRVSHG